MNLQITVVIFRTDRKAGVRVVVGVGHVNVSHCKSVAEQLLLSFVKVSLLFHNQAFQTKKVIFGPVL